MYCILTVCSQCCHSRHEFGMVGTVGHFVSLVCFHLDPAGLRTQASEENNRVSHKTILCRLHESENIPTCSFLS